MSARVWAALVASGSAAVAGCGPPEAKAEPTWAEVQPILAGQCLSCHGSTALKKGGGFRFDFYDMSAETCGEAAEALGIGFPLASARAPHIINAIASGSVPGQSRPLMPPSPAPYLEAWQGKTLNDWWQSGVPKGDRPSGNRPARVDVFRSATLADKGFDLTAILSDPDGDPVVGVLKMGAHLLPMDRSGSFSAHVDTSAWTAGSYVLTAVLCDGWSQVSYAVSTLEIRHEP